MKEFKIGGKVTISKNESYIIVDIIEYNNETYYFTSSINKPIVPKIFQRIEEDGKIFIDIIDDEEIINYVHDRIVNSDK